MAAESVPSAVLDTNLIVSAFLSRRGAPHALLQALYEGAFRLILSDALRQEYAGVLARPGLKRRYVVPAANVAAFFRFLDRRAGIVTPAPAVQLPSATTRTHTSSSRRSAARPSTWYRVTTTCAPWPAIPGWGRSRS